MKEKQLKNPTNVQRIILIQLLKNQPIMDKDLLKELKPVFTDLTIRVLREQIKELADGWRYIEAHETQRVIE